MDLSSIRGEMKDIDWKAIDNKKQSTESNRPKEYQRGGKSMGDMKAGEKRGEQRQASNVGNNRNVNHSKNNSLPRPEEKEVEFWVTEENYLEHAEKVIQNLMKNSLKKDDTVSVSQIRNILANMSDIYNVVHFGKKDKLSSHNKELDEAIKAKIRELIMHCYYGAGREKTVKTFFLKSSLFMNLKGILESSALEGQKEMPAELQNLGEKGRFLLVHKYLESLVAFHRFYGGKDS